MKRHPARARALAVRMALAFALPLTLVSALNLTQAASGAGAKDGGAVPTPGDAHIAALTARCSLAMLQGSCRAMKSEPATASSPRPGGEGQGERVFVAGFGEIDAAAYAGFRAQGDAMCQTVQQRCQEHWEGQACRAARALFPEASNAAQALAASAS